MTDNDFLQALLEEYRGEWLSQMSIIEISQERRGCGLTVHSRASELRTERGLDVECQTKRAWDPEKQNHSGRVYSFYRLSKPSPAQGPPLDGEREAHEANGAVTGGASTDAPDGRAVSQPEPRGHARPGDGGGSGEQEPGMGARTPAPIQVAAADRTLSPPASAAAQPSLFDMPVVPEYA